MRAESTSADARLAAVTALARVESHAAHAARLLRTSTPAEREMVMGTLRWRLTLDHLLERHLRTPLAGLDPRVRAALRLGLYEARRMRTPVPVAVAEAVRLTKSLAPRAAGLVNAVLRRAVGEPWPEPGDAAVPLSLRYSHPAWLVERWSRLLGEGATVAALVASQEPAPLYLLAAATAVGDLEAAGCELLPHPVVAGVAAVSSGVDAAVAALRAGRAYAMDPTAVAVARVLPATGGTVVDLAAAPGGKSLVLTSERPGGRMVAADRNLGRVLLMRANLAFAGRGAQVVVADGAATPLRPGTCAAVVLDAPCSGTGTLRRHPEIRWRLGAGDLAGFAEGQRRLAAAAAGLLAPGGYLLYATCSLEAEENAEVVAALALERVPVAPRLPNGLPLVELPTGGAVVPPWAGGDGFTVHLLRSSA